MADNAEGVVVDHVVVKGNPPDAPMLVPAVARITGPLRSRPRAVTADRGYGEAKIRLRSQIARRANRGHFPGAAGPVRLAARFTHGTALHQAW